MRHFSPGECRFVICGGYVPPSVIARSTLSRWVLPMGSSFPSLSIIPFYQPFLSIISVRPLWDRLKTKKALIFIRTVSAVRKGLELALSRGDIVIRKPPVKHSLDIPSGEEVEGSAAMGPSENKKGPDFHQDRFCGAEGARTLDLRRDRPAF